MSETYIFPLNYPDATIETVGGKGMSLAKMLHAGFPVPEGFHVTTAAYRRFVSENGIQPHITDALSDIDVEISAPPEAVALQIRDRFARGQIPADIAAAIARAYQSLQDIPVAVRSSATAEDLPEASFAGQQDTYLNVCGVNEVLDAVKGCWASLWSARAIRYRMRQGISPESVALAVVVQEMVPAEMAGILFTANPINNRRDEVVIDAAWGLGEAIVGGRVNPDTLIIDKDTGRAKHVQVAEKTIQTVPVQTGTEEQPVEAQNRMRRVLSDELAFELTQLGRQIEAFWAAPQDVEWCRAKGRFYIVQARPITTLFPLPAPLPDPKEGLRIYLCVNIVLQGITEPLTPMGWDIFRLLYIGMLAELMGKPGTAYPAWIKNAAGRMYLDITGLVRNPRIGAEIAGRFAEKDFPATRVLNQILVANAEKIRCGRKTPLPWRLFGKVAPRMLVGVLYSFLAPRAGRAKVYALGEALVAPLERRARQLTTYADRLGFVEEATRQVFWKVMYQVAYCTSGFRSYEFIPALLKKWLGADTLAQPVLQALPYNPTTEMGQVLVGIALRLQKEGASPTPDHPAVQEFLAKYGHRTVREIDTGLPRWRDDSSYVLAMLAAYTSQNDLEAKLDQFRAAQSEADAAIPRVVAEVKRRKGPIHAWLIGHLMRCVREVGGLREQPKFDLIRCLALVRRVLADVGQDLVAQGRLDTAEDVFYVTLADIRASGDLRARAAGARADFIREVARTSVPRFMTSTGECFYSAPVPREGNILVGSPVSPGVYEGVARIVQTPGGGQLEPGEILITHSTDPSWTPLFLNAGAVIMETGGPISHGAIVAREYGIPAVAGVSGATTRLQTGQRLRVNGETGEITW